ncbi:MAG: hypothetical protein IID37_09005 [Planctomycetes bacterium]|nr:hypothetical protein [Planctomycetota bacterium]
MKRTVPLVITFVVGVILIISSFVPRAQGWGVDATICFDVLAAIAFVLGGGNLLKMHLRKVSDQKEGWGYSAVTVIAFLATLTIGLLKLGVDAAPKYPDYPWSGNYIETGGSFWFIYEFLFKPLTATMFSMLAFYVASAAFRAFRAKNFEAVLLLGTAFIILLGRTYAGAYLSAWIPAGWEGWTIPGLSATIMDVLNTAGNRAIMIGICLGVVSTSLKVILGIDRSYLGKE